MLRILVISIITLLCMKGFSQRSIGSWQDYLSYTEAKKVAVAPDKIYCATEGGLFFYDLQDNSVTKFTGYANLSDFGIKTIAYSKANEMLIVAYNNSNIDLVSSGSFVINLSDIKRKQITGDKSINNITISGSEAFLSCGFGIVVLNLNKQEIKDTYFIGENGSMLTVFDTEVHDGYIYAATVNGLRRASATSNLQNYNNWEQVEDIPRANSKFNHLAVHNGDLIANYTPDQYDGDEMYRLSGGTWNPYQPQIRYAHEIQVSENYLTVCSREDVYVIDNNHAVVGKLNYYQIEDVRVSPISPVSASVSSDGSIWIGDTKNALVRFYQDRFESVFPNGPIDNQVFSLHANGTDIWVTAGGRSDSWNNIWQSPRFQLNRSGEWSYFNSTVYPELSGFHDVVCIAPDPSDPDHLFVGSWGGGVLEFRNNEFIQRYTNKNSPLQTALPNQPDEPYVRIGGLDIDSQGNLWITNAQVAKNLLKLSPAGEWETYTLPEVANSKNIGQLIVTQNDDKWILVPRGNDAYVVDKTGDRKKQLLVTSYFNNGENEIFTRMNDVYSIAEDNKGAIWIGTSKGVALYNNPFRIWDSETFYAVQPGLDLNDGLYHPLLATETVTAIAVDGANRKWFGTKNSGAFLISENGEKELLHFNTENSPLFSNQITSIAINQKNGEVFFGTAKGLLSYKGDAIGGKGTYADVYVYPNPVRESYLGPVTVTGLIENSDIKITDISGNLVYKTTSLGGQVIWDGKNLNGNRVKTGIYLIFCNDKQGNETHIEKLLFIN